MCFVDMSSANCLGAFWCIVFRRGFLLGWQQCTTIWCRMERMVWALTGWPLGTSGGVTVSKLDKQTYTSEFESHRAPHSFGLVPPRSKGLCKLLTGWPPPPLQSLQQCWQNSYADLSTKAFGCNAQYVRSAFLDDLPEACFEWTPHF